MCAHTASSEGAGEEKHKDFLVSQPNQKTANFKFSERWWLKKTYTSLAPNTSHRHMHTHPQMRIKFPNLGDWNKNVFFNYVFFLFKFYLFIKNKNFNRLIIYKKKLPYYKTHWSWFVQGKSKAVGVTESCWGGQGIILFWVLHFSVRTQGLMYARQHSTTELGLEPRSLSLTHRIVFS